MDFTEELHFKIKFITGEIMCSVEKHAKVEESTSLESDLNDGGKNV